MAFDIFLESNNLEFFALAEISGAWPIKRFFQLSFDIFWNNFGKSRALNSATLSRIRVGVLKIWLREI